MPAIDVEPESLGDLGRRLERAAKVAVRMELIGGHGLHLHDDDVGDVHVAKALSSFVTSWSHGCRLLRDDAATLADLLCRAGAVYLDVESAIAGEPR